MDNQKSIIARMTFLFLLIFSIICIEFISPIFSLTTTSWIVVFTFGISISYNLLFLKMHLLSFPQVYLAVTFLFTSGGLLLHCFGSEIAFDKFKWFNEKSVTKAAEIVFLAIISFQLGLHFVFNKKQISIKEDLHYKRHAVPLQSVSVILLILSSFVFIFIYPYFFSMVMKSGYQNFVFYQQENDVRIPITLFHWLLPLLCIILTCAHYNKSQKNFSYFVASILCLLFLLTGDRGGCFSFMLAFLVTMKSKGSKFTNIQVIMLSIIILFIIPVLFELRNLSSVDIQNPIEQALQETGSSLQVLMGTTMIIPETEDYMYGEAYLSAIAKVAPNLGAWQLSEQITLSRWIKQYMSPQGSGLGFLKIAEAYSQFGITGVWCVFLLFGMVIGSWYRNIVYDKNRLYNHIWKSYSFYIMLIWIRNYAEVSIRPIVWSFIFLMCIKYASIILWKEKD